VLLLLLLMMNLVMGDHYRRLTILMLLPYSQIQWED